MCGIAAVVGGEQTARLRDLVTMLRRLEHRGRPETLHEHRHFQEELFACGTNRLAIVQPDTGAQPVYSPSRRFVVVMNGEVFNYRDLARALVPNGRLAPRGDVAVLSHALEEWGIDKTLASLVWEGAFIALDRRERRVIAARDHVGIKPLYRCESHGATYFASEVKALLDLGGQAEIEPVPPGFVIEYALPHAKMTSSRRWWEAPSDVREVSRPELAEHVQDLLRTSIAYRVPDEPYAVLLSGGIDSSLVLRLAVEYNSDVTAYVLCRPDSPDLPYARLLCEQLSVPLVEVPAAEAPELRSGLDSVIQSLESWEWQVVNHAAPMDRLLGTIRADGFKVVLSGEGADELFLGYDEAQSSSSGQLPNDFRQIRVAELHKTNCRRLDRMGMRHGVECRVPFLDRALTELALTAPRSMLASRSVNKIPVRDVGRELLSDDFSSRQKLSFAKGVGYRYGRSAPDGAESVFGHLEVPPEIVLTAPWSHLPRYRLERLFMRKFLDAGFGRAIYLASRSM